MFNNLHINVLTIALHPKHLIIMVYCWTFVYTLLNMCITWIFQAWVTSIKLFKFFHIYRYSKRKQMNCWMSNNKLIWHWNWTIPQKSVTLNYSPAVINTELFQEISMAVTGLRFSLQSNSCTCVHYRHFYFSMQGDLTAPVAWFPLHARRSHL